MWSVEQGARLAANHRPFDLLVATEVRTAEIIALPIEDDGIAGVINFPKTTAKASIFSPNEKVAMQMNIPKFENAVLADDEFLSHTLILREPTCSVRATR